MIKRTKKSPPTPDADLTIRIRELLYRRRGVSEKRMFGGDCFMINGNMATGVTKKEQLMVRVGPKQYQACLEHPHTREMDFTKRPLRGFVYVDEIGFEKDADLKHWVEKGVAFARSLPPKPKK